MWNPYKWGGDRTTHIMPAPQPKAAPIPPAIIQYLSMAELKVYLGTENSLKVELIRQGCKMMNIPFVGGGTIFFQTPSDLLKDFESLVLEMNKQLHPGLEYLVAYEKLDRPLTKFSYYKVIALRSNDMLDFKKAFKVQKLKAFL